MASSSPGTSRGVQLGPQRDDEGVAGEHPPTGHHASLPGEDGLHRGLQEVDPPLTEHRRTNRDFVGLPPTQHHPEEGGGTGPAAARPIDRPARSGRRRIGSGAGCPRGRARPRRRRVRSPSDPHGFTALPSSFLPALSGGSAVPVPHARAPAPCAGFSRSVSGMRHATAEPDRNVRAATARMAAGMPKASDTTPLTSAPTAYPLSRHSR